MVRLLERLFSFWSLLVHLICTLQAWGHPLHQSAPIEPPLAAPKREATPQRHPPLPFCNNGASKRRTQDAKTFEARSNYFQSTFLPLFFPPWTDNGWLSGDEGEGRPRTSFRAQKTNWEMAALFANNSHHHHQSIIITQSLICEIIIRLWSVFQHYETTLAKRLKFQKL